MAAFERKAVTRTVTVSDLSPSELASIFSAYDDNEQAAFFDALAEEVKDWPGSGWCMQCAWFIPKLSKGGKDIVAKMAEWLEQTHD